MSQLEADPEFWSASPEVIASICNGCGTGGWKGLLVPDTVWGLSIELPCHIHDWDYHHGHTEAEKKAADERFLRNMLSKVNNRGGPLKYPRRARVHTYYWSVVIFGGPAFRGDNAVATDSA